MKYHKIPESSIQAELELDWDFLEHSRTYQLFGIIWNNFSQGKAQQEYNRGTVINIYILQRPFWVSLIFYFFHWNAQVSLK